MCGAAGGTGELGRLSGGQRVAHPLTSAAFLALADAPVDPALALGSSCTWLLCPQTGFHVCACVCACVIPTPALESATCPRSRGQGEF